MPKFDVRYVHKVSQTCRCGRTRYDHSTPRPDGTVAYGEGACALSGCVAFVTASEIHDLDLDLDSAFGARTLGRVLRAARLVGRDDYLRWRITRSADGKIVCFPRTGIWHAIILTPIA